MDKYKTSNVALMDHLCHLISDDKRHHNKKNLNKLKKSFQTDVSKVFKCGVGGINSSPGPKRGSPKPAATRASVVSCG